MNIRKTLPIESEQLIIREFSLDDIDKFHYLCEQEEVTKWFSGWKIDKASAKKLVEKYITLYKEFDITTTNLNFIVEQKTDREFVGYCLLGPEPATNEVEIVYAVSRDFQNKGIATAISKLLSKWAFENFEIEYLVATVNPENIASNKVVEKAGFKRHQHDEFKDRNIFYYRLYRYDILMKYIFVPMDEKYANEITYRWKYEGIYSFYDITADKEDLEEFLDSKQWEYKFAVLNASKELIGFYSYYLKNDIMWIGFGLKPELTGKGYGSDFVMSGIRFGVKHFNYSKDYIMLAVVEFNQRAIKAYQKIGFMIIEEYIQETNGGKHKFIKMSKNI